MTGLDRLLKLEEELDPWHTTIGELHPWAFIRTSVLEQLMKRERGFSEARPPDRKGPNLLSRARTHLATYRGLKSRKAQGSEVLFLTPGTVRIPVEGKQGSVNRLYDDYYGFFQEPLILEMGYPVVPGEPRVHPERVYRMDTVQFLLRLRARLGGLSGDHKTRAQRFIDEVADGFGLADRREWIEEMTLMHLRWALRRDLLDRYIDTSVTSGLAFVHSASYMKWYGLLTRWLHERGLTVVEVQHGYVSLHHPAYNHPSSVLEEADHPSRQYLPDHLLTFGSYWAEQVRVPSQVHVVGYPHLDRLSRERQASAECRPHDILFISQGYVTTQLVEVASALAQAFPDRTLHFKLHPGEVDYTDRYAPLHEHPNVRVLKEGDIYQLIAGCGIIVGSFSTALFEAANFDDKRLFYLESDLVPPTLGHAFATPGELVEAIGDGGAGRPGIAADELWHPGWNKAFNDFVTRERPR